MNHMILIPVAAFIVAQVIKLLIDSSQKKFNWRDLISYGGMPSGHTATVISLVIAIGYFDGVMGAAFTVAVIVAGITISDAIGFRYELGRHAKLINDHVSQLPSEEKEQFDRLNERIGHTPLESFAGAVVGVIVAVVYILPI